VQVLRDRLLAGPDGPGGLDLATREPDPRFTLANERTFLAWARTALGFIAAGVALHALDSGEQEALRGIASMAAVIGGAALAVAAWMRWLAVERSLRRGRPLPFPFLGIGLLGLVVALTVLALVLAVAG